MSDLISRQAALISIKNLYPDMPIIDFKRSRRNWFEKYAPYFECENVIEQLPSAEPTGDLINRQAVGYAIDKWVKKYRILAIIPTDEVTPLFEAIHELPSAEPTEWIPVSERLPEDGTYLVTVERMDGEPSIDMRSFAKDLNKVNEFDFPKHKCGWYDYDSEYGYWEEIKVIAWMPLPEPYKAESEDKG